MAIIELRPSARVAVGKPPAPSGNDGPAEVGRIRLSDGEIRLIRDVLGDWVPEGRGDGPTMYEATVDKLAKDAARGELPAAVRPMPDADIEDTLLAAATKRVLRLSKKGAKRTTPVLTRLERKRRKWARADAELEAGWQLMKVSGGMGAKKPTMFAIERWAEMSTANERFGREKTWKPELYPREDALVDGGRRRGRCEDMLRCYRTLRRMMNGGRQTSFSLVILNALYGGLPPGLPREKLWGTPRDRALDHEYRRVCRYAPSAGGGGAYLEAILDGEGVDAAEVLRAVARECEALIVAAAGDYRAAWRAGQ